ncbi:MAG: phosphate/phosphite/phosphonate ABC transporter substrate-binding protein [Pseudomonadota bacterium]|jgi:phosphonate transport system substrate-binding protein
MNRMMIKIAARIACICLPFFGMLPPAAAADELVLGIFPFLSTRQMVEQFTPLKDHLSRAAGKPVTLRSAPDYKSFIERTASGEYDVIIDAPHLARLAQKRDGYQPLAQSGYKVEFMVVARKDSPVQSLADLRGRAVAIGARLSLTHMLLGKELLKSGLVLDRDVQYLDTATFSNVLQAVIRGDAAVGALTALVWNGAPPEARSELREILRQKDLGPGLIVVAHPRLGAAMQGKLQTALYGFKDTPAGQAYFQKTRQIDFRPVDEADLRVMDAYTELLVKP